MAFCWQTLLFSHISTCNAATCMLKNVGCIQAEQQLQQVRSTGERQEAEFAGLQRGIETANQNKAAAQAEVHRYAAVTSFCLCLACRANAYCCFAQTWAYCKQ